MCYFKWSQLSYIIYEMEDEMAGKEWLRKSLENVWLIGVTSFLNEKKIFFIALTSYSKHASITQS